MTSIGLNSELVSAYQLGYLLPRRSTALTICDQIFNMLFVIDISDCLATRHNFLSAESAQHTNGFALLASAGSGSTARLTKQLTVQTYCFLQFLYCVMFFSNQGEMLASIPSKFSTKC